jgi:hypothetical protein
MPVKARRKHYSDPLRLSARRVPGCAQVFRDVARQNLDDFTPKELEARLAATRCGGHGCLSCGDAALRLVGYVAWHQGTQRGLELARWVRCYLAPLAQSDFKLRVEDLLAFLLRHTSRAESLSALATSSTYVETSTPPERAFHYARAAYVLAEARRFDEARHSVRVSRKLFAAGAPDDPERGPAWAALADTYTEVSAAYCDHNANLLDAFWQALKALPLVDDELAPRTCDALTTNLVATIVTASRAGLTDIEPGVVLSELERLFDFSSRRSDPYATNFRWMWTLLTAKSHGFSVGVRNRIRNTRHGLILQGRSRDLLFFELDIFWIACYRPSLPRGANLLACLAYVERALHRVRESTDVLAPIRQALRGNTSQLTREILSPLFALRRVPSHQVRDLRFS